MANEPAGPESDADVLVVGTWVFSGWRGAVPLHDPEGVAAAMDVRALEGRCDGWVAEQITDLAAGVRKLVAALGNSDRPGTAVQRSVLATRLTRPSSPSIAASFTAPRTASGNLV